MVVKRRLGKRFPRAEEGEWIQPRMRNYFLMCCDCGLTHRMDFRIVRKPNGTQRVQFRAFHDARGTANSRRAHRARKDLPR